MSEEREYPPNYFGLYGVINIYADDYLRVKHAGMYGEEIPVDIIAPYLGHERATQQLEEAYRYGRRIMRKSKLLKALYKRKIRETRKPPT